MKLYVVVRSKKAKTSNSSIEESMKCIAECFQRKHSVTQETDDSIFAKYLTSQLGKIKKMMTLSDMWNGSWQKLCLMLLKKMHRNSSSSSHRNFSMWCLVTAAHYRFFIFHSVNVLNRCSTTCRLMSSFFIFPSPDGSERSKVIAVLTHTFRCTLVLSN